MKGHPHEEYVFAWLNGREVKYTWAGNGNWKKVLSLSTFDIGQHSNIVFMIEAEKKPDICHSFKAGLSESDSLSFYYMGSYNVKLTFDGETRQLIKAEVISND